VVAGKANKVVAIDLSISERTVELHRGRIMKKMRARSLAELMRVVLPPGQDMAK
jgi:two-component system response regulator FixJ